MEVECSMTKSEQDGMPGRGMLIKEHLVGATETTLNHSLQNAKLDKVRGTEWTSVVLLCPAL
jgi:hypothetical protein